MKKRLAEQQEFEILRARKTTSGDVADVPKLGTFECSVSGRTVRSTVH